MKDMKQCRVLVTPASYGKDDVRLKTDLENQVGEVIYNPAGRPLSSEEVRRLLPGIDGYIAGLDKIDRAALEAADCLKVIARYGMGYDSVDLQAAREKAIIVTNTPEANSVSVAELTLMFILALARQLPTAISTIHKGGWPRLPGVTLEGKTIGLLGLGSIGKQVARRLAGFDCRILAYDLLPDREFAQVHRVSLSSLEELLAQSDFVSLHLPLLPETRGMVSQEFLARMKPGAFLINTSRGEVVDEAALLEALQSRRLQGAGLDVLAVEPPDPRNPLLALPQVIATPHLGAQTDGATNNMGRMALANCLAVLRGEEPPHRIA
jgi:phosphoglycerate dehydrogenase-like enzyme